MNQYLTLDYWCNMSQSSHPVKRLTGKICVCVSYAVRRTVGENVMDMASSLTYSTLLAIVPILAIVFAIARGFGFATLIEDKLKENFSQSPELVSYLINFVDHYLVNAQSSGIFIGVGFIMLLYTVIMLTRKIEQAFNEVWMVKHPRALFRVVTDYTSIFFLLPLVIVVSSGLSIYLNTVAQQMEGFLMLSSFVKLVIELSPLLLYGLFFTLCYTFMPNTYVRLIHTILPAFLAATGMQILQYFYINSQIWLSSYNAIYGSFAALPLLMFFLQLTWTIALFGAELSYASQHLEFYSTSRGTEQISRRTHDFIALTLMAAISRRFNEGKTPYTPESLAHTNHIPLQLVTNILYELQKAGLLVMVSEDNKEQAVSYIPSSDTHQMTVSRFLGTLNAYGNDSQLSELALAYPTFWQAASNLHIPTDEDKPLCEL